ncbi:MAG: heparan-alpha-glucosaminide N-acetyltransferase domain-containing protein [Spirosomataceae bacterium]
MKRITVIDFMRGLVMLVMAIDHLRDLTHISALTTSPTDLSTTTPSLFMTRWITHLCAPIFVFLSGASVFLSLNNQRDIPDFKRFLLSRGIWLILLELTVISLGIWFDILFRFLMLQVIFAIGAGFILLSFLLKLRPNTLGIMGLVIIFGHNLLQGIVFEKAFVLNFIWALLFNPNFFAVSSQFNVLINYPIVPWFGIMLLGYACGQLFLLPVEKRTKYLWQIGGIFLLLFMVIRFANGYGDPSKWTSQSTFLFIAFIY